MGNEMVHVEYRKIGELKVSTLGLGGHQFGAIWGVSQKDLVKQIVNTALDLGINVIDTAETYNDGLSEKLIGEVLKERGDRENVVIFTKISVEHLRYHQVIKAVKGSLERLKTNYLDVVMIHWPDPYVPVRETIKALDELVDKGIIIHIGVSNFPPCLVEEAIACSKHGIVLNEVLYNLIERDIEKEILPRMKKLNVAVVAYSPLAMGYLTGKYLKPVLKSEDDPRRFIPWAQKEEYLGLIKPLLEAMKKVAYKYNKTLVQVALNWILAQDIFVIFGATKVEHVLENIGAMGWRLTSEDMEYLRAVSDKVINELNKYCIDC